MATGTAAGPAEPVELDANVLKVIRHRANRLARRIPRGGVADADDLFQAGVAAILAAVRDGVFDPDKSSLATYANFRAAGAMLDFLRACDPSPRLMRQQAKAGGVPVPVTLSLSKVRVPARNLFGEQDGRGVRFDPPHHDAEITDGDELEFGAVLRRLLPGLRTAERRLMVWYYARGLTMREIGDRLGVCDSRVSQMHAAILGRCFSADERQSRESVYG